MKYKNLFFDLDDTIWNFSQNACDSLKEVYRKYEFERYFESFQQFYTLYIEKNQEVWLLYAADKIDKEELNRRRFLYPLEVVNVPGREEIARAYAKDFLDLIPTRTKLIPGSLEVLEYLYPHYNLYIISNGFRELQSRKLQASGIDRFFQKVILSEDIQSMKPSPTIFNFALSATQSTVENSLMIGDNFIADITGARGVGMDQVFFNPAGTEVTDFQPTYTIKELGELMSIL